MSDWYIIPDGDECPATCDGENAVAYHLYAMTRSILAPAKNGGSCGPTYYGGICQKPCPVECEVCLGFRF